MTSRIDKLKHQSLNAINKISAERALLITEFYKSSEDKNYSIPVHRAKAFEFILSNKKICINNGELIVGERGPEPKATPSYPEVCLHTLEDLKLLDSRPKVSFKVDNETFDAFEQTIIPYWKGKTQRQRIFSLMPQEWLQAYKTGVFTEFQEQRAPGHTVAGKKIYHQGMLDFINQIDQVKQQVDLLNDREALDKIEQLNAMKVAAQSMVHFAGRHAELLEQKVKEEEEDTARKQEMLKLAQICRNVPANAPTTFHEALQHYWFIHVGVITELNPWDSFNPGRLDQHLYPFYKKEIENGTLTPEKAKELLQAFWIKFNNHPAPPKVGVTALESNTYTDFALINIGGLKEDGSDATNEVTYLLLDVIEEMRLLQPSSMVQVSKKNPDRLIKRTAKITATGYGQPSYFNSDAIIQQLLRQGKKIEDARNGGASGCVETGAFGVESYILTGYFNLNKVLEVTLNNGFDPVSGMQIGLGTGNIDQFSSFDELFDAFTKQLNYFIDIKIKGNNIIEKLYAKYIPAPFLSLIIDDCIQNAKDYNNGGARYNTSYIQGVGIGSITDNLTAIKYHIFDNQHFSLKFLLDAMKNNFEGNEELQHALIYETPKWGNDDDYADKLAIRVFDAFFKSVDAKPTARGGVFRINLLPTTSHVYFGSVLGAMPDGRKAKEPISEGISPVQGADQKGPSAVIKSASKLDHLKTGRNAFKSKIRSFIF